MGRPCRAVAALLLLIVSFSLATPAACSSGAQQGRANYREEDAPSAARLIQAGRVREALRQPSRYRSSKRPTAFPQWPPWPWAQPPATAATFPPLEDAGSPSSAPTPSPAVAKPLAAPRHAAHGITLPPEPATAVTRGAVATGEASEAAGHGRGPATARRRIYVIAGAGASVLAAVSAALLVLCYRSSKVVTVRPWATGLSGQLQKAFVTGVPALKRSELEAACEDFSNVISAMSDYMMYKGTLSSGVEIAVVSTTKSSAKDWSKHCETQFRKKITSLSRVNHKNFVNLLGYCQEEQPFTRMMVFEYAPNGTLFEHLHAREDGHLDWPTRLRVAVGIAYCPGPAHRPGKRCDRTGPSRARGPGPGPRISMGRPCYCLEHMHQLSPPEILGALDTSTVYLTDDFAAKIADVFFCSDEASSSSTRAEMASLQSPAMSDRESVVYSYGMVLLEIMSGRFTSSDGGLLEGWAAAFLRGERQLRDVMDAGLSTNAPLQAETVNRLDSVIRSCTDREARRRPAMTEVARRLREITAMPPDAATPKVSPLWWAELEIISTEAT